MLLVAKIVNVSARWALGLAALVILTFQKSDFGCCRHRGAGQPMRCWLTWTSNKYQALKIEERQHLRPSFTQHIQTHRSTPPAMSVPSLAPQIMKRPWLQRWMKPLSQWYFDNAGYRKLGLRYAPLQPQKRGSEAYTHVYIERVTMLTTDTDTMGAAGPMT